MAADPSRWRRTAVGVLASLLLALLAACSGSGEPAGSDPGPSSSSTTESARASNPAWRDLDRRLGELGPNRGLLVAEVGEDGRCRPIHEVASRTARPTASQFKLLVLGALADRIGAGALSWDRTVVVEDRFRSLGNGPGSLQYAPPDGTTTISAAASTMISISDNTAADLLIDVVGREQVEHYTRRIVAHPETDEPFLTTRQMFLLHYVAGLGDRYLATPRPERADFLASSVDPLSLEEIASGFSTDPRHIDQIEWFASPTDLCAAFAALHRRADDPALSPELDRILSKEVAGIDLGAERWPTVWYKGGSEPGVLTMGWLATDAEGRTFVVEAMVSDPDAPLADDAITDLVGIGRDAFAQLP